MNRRQIARLVQAAVIALALPTLAFGATSASEYSAAKDRAAADYKAAKAQCDRLSGNQKDVCVAEAKAAEKKAKADAEASYKNTDAARRNARIAAAEADYDVANAKCGGKTGNDKDVCKKEAQATKTKVVADAKATEKIVTAKADAKEDKMDAEYKVAIEKCDALSGAAKDSCVSAAKVKYRK